MRQDRAASLAPFTTALYPDELTPKVAPSGQAQGDALQPLFTTARARGLFDHEILPSRQMTFALDINAGKGLPDSDTGPKC